MRKGFSLWIGFFLLGIVAAAAADEALITKLPPPHKEGGMPLMQALQARHSSREFSAEPLPAQTLSDLLWAAAGVTRPDGKRTAPSARDWREVEIYLISPGAVDVYLPESHVLRRVANRDVRALAGRQDYPATAPLNLVYVADTRRMTGADAEQQTFYAATDTGFIAENVYLYCASAGLNVVVRANVDRDALALALGLAPQQRVTLAQTVGYPKPAK